ncbi:MAG: radical SAM protein [Promethearchaeia archaeon]
MLTGIHFLLTYSCNFECDHCFLYCSPRSEGTFTIRQIKKVLDEAKRLETVKEIYFEGGEPFLFYPIMIEGIKMASKAGFNVGIVSNSYWATDIQDSIHWLKPLKEFKLFDFSISNDFYHFNDIEDNRAFIAAKAAKMLKLPVNSISIEDPDSYLKKVKESLKQGKEFDIYLRFRGRAVDKLVTPDLRIYHWSDLKSCSHEDLKDLGRVHVDSFGNIFICQGLSIGNYLDNPFSEIINNYDPLLHPIIRPLLEGGPAKLIEEYHIDHKIKYADECHLCYEARKTLLARFPKLLGPKQVYGL